MNPDWRARNPVVLVLAAACLLLWMALQIDPVQKIAASLVDRELTEENAAYLDRSEKQAARTLFHLIESYAALRVIQSGEVGFSLIVETHVQVGDAIAGLTTIVERGIGVAALSATAAAAMKQLDRAAALLSPMLFELTLALLGVYLIARAIHAKHPITQLAHSITEVAGILFLTAFLLVPYSIHVSGWLGHQVVAPLKRQSTQHYVNLHKDIQHARADSERHGRAKAATHALERMFSDIGHRAEASSLAFVKHAAAALLEGIVLPLTIFATLLLILRMGARKIRRILEAPGSSPGQKV